MLLGAKKQRETLIRLAEEFVRECESGVENDGIADSGSGISEALEHWLAVRDNPTACTAVAEEVERGGNAVRCTGGGIGTGRTDVTADSKAVGNSEAGGFSGETLTVDCWRGWLGI